MIRVRFAIPHASAEEVLMPAVPRHGELVALADQPILYVDNVVWAPGADPDDGFDVYITLTQDPRPLQPHS